jgi:hypothetical protein
MMARKRPENRNTAARRSQREQRAQAQTRAPEPDPVPVRYEFTEGSGDINAHIVKREDAGWALHSMHIDPAKTVQQGRRWWVFCWMAA